MSRSAVCTRILAKVDTLDKLDPEEAGYVRKRYDVCWSIVLLTTAGHVVPTAQVMARLGDVEMLVDALSIKAQQKLAQSS